VGVLVVLELLQALFDTLADQQGDQCTVDEGMNNVLFLGGKSFDIIEGL
jgi:hypothetical protein